MTLHPVTDGTNEDILIDILDVQTYPQTEDVTGAVFGGYIKLRCFLRPAFCAVWFHDANSLYAERRETCTSLTQTGSPSDIIVWPDREDQFGPEKLKRATVWLMPIQIWRNERGDRCTEGLVLSGQANFHAFRRMGKFKVAVGAKVAEMGVYGVGDEAWVGKGGRELLKAQGPWVERIITLI